MSKVELGTKLKNGATVIAYDEANDRVLCHFQSSFVVWGYINVTSLYVCYGYYYGQDLDGAIEAFNRNKVNDYWEK
jgi:hypothetical protein